MQRLHDFRQRLHNVVSKFSFFTFHCIISPTYDKSDCCIAPNSAYNHCSYPHKAPLEYTSGNMVKPLSYHKFQQCCRIFQTISWYRLNWYLWKRCYLSRSQGVHRDTILHLLFLSISYWCLYWRILESLWHLLAGWYGSSWWIR